MVSRRIKDMKIYTKQDLDRAWWNMTTEQRHNHQIWYAFCEAYKTAPDYGY